MSLSEVANDLHFNKRTLEHHLKKLVKFEEIKCRKHERSGRIVYFPKKRKTPKIMDNYDKFMSQINGRNVSAVEIKENLGWSSRLVYKYAEICESNNDIKITKKGKYLYYYK